MLYFSRMRWKLDGMDFNQLWKLEGQEAKAAVESIKAGFIPHLYKPCAEQYVISVGNTRTVEDFDRYAEGVLPMREHLVFEQVWPLEEGFCIDVYPYLEKRRAEMADTPRLLHLLQVAWDPRSHRMDEVWPRLVGELGTLQEPRILAVYRVAGQQRALIFVDVVDAAGLNRIAALPSLAGAEVELVEALRDYLGFAEDVWRSYKLD
ncbi:MAG: hypothetical protein H6843_12445 [Rhodospirillaceae bacterium]|nr:hypothetical protein [Rhodospirillaceae bacterium]